MTDRTGKTVLITGATSGIGEATAKALARQGARVFVVGRDQTRGAAVVQELTRAGGTGEFLSANLLSLKDVACLADEVMKRTSSLDVLVNNAGVVPHQDDECRQHRDDLRPQHRGCVRTHEPFAWRAGTGAWACGQHRDWLFKQNQMARPVVRAPLPARHGAPGLSRCGAADRQNSAVDTQEQPVQLLCLCLRHRFSDDGRPGQPEQFAQSPGRPALQLLQVAIARLVATIITHHLQSGRGRPW
jgi:short chain dehydrogenase